MSGRLSPVRTSVQYAVRKPLLDWLAAQDVRGLRVLDVGCGNRPYDALLEGAAEIVGFDRPGNPDAVLHGSIDAVRDWVKIMVVVDLLGLALAAWLYETIQESEA